MRGRTTSRTLAAVPVVAAVATTLGLALLVATNGVAASVSWGLAGNVSAAVALLGAGTLLIRPRAGWPRSGSPC